MSIVVLNERRARFPGKRRAPRVHISSARPNVVGERRFLFQLRHRIRCPYCTPAGAALSANDFFPSKVIVEQAHC